MKLTEAGLANLTAQLVHVLVTVLLVLLVAIVFPGNVYAVWGSLIALLAVAYWKEAFWDPSHETNQPFWDQGAMDFAFYLVGAVIAGFVLELLVHIGRLAI
jgi:hypothetical protein